MAAPAAPQLHVDADEEDDGQEEALNEHQLAKVDPLSGGLVDMWRTAVVGREAGLAVRLSACHSPSPSLAVASCRQCRMHLFRPLLRRPAAHEPAGALCVPADHSAHSGSSGPLAVRPHPVRSCCVQVCFAVQLLVSCVYAAALLWRMMQACGHGTPHATPILIRRRCPPLLTRRCCQAGKDVANQVLDTPGMTNALKAVLDAPPPPLPAGGAAAEGPVGESTRGTAMPVG